MEITETTTLMLPVGGLHANEGQLQALGVPANPRQISEDDYRKLVTSLREKNMTGVLPLKVYEHEGEWIVLGGNMRLRALRELGVEQVSCIIVPKETDGETLREIVIKDNSTLGDWDNDMLANEWNADELNEWGVDVPEAEYDSEEKETSKLSEIKVNSMYHEPENHPQLTLDKCVDLTKYEAKMAALREMGLSEEQMRILEIFARRFIRIDFESVANYYAFNASEKEKDAIERLRLVLVDGGGIDGFMEDGLLRIREELLQIESEDE